MSLTSNQYRLSTMDLEPYEKKSRRWGKRNPVAKGAQISNSVSFERSDVKTDGKGNVISMPPLVGKPCFGIPTAHLRQGRGSDVYVNKLRRTVNGSRCSRCNISDPCNSLVRERIECVLKASAQFRVNLKEWIDAGGGRQGGFDGAYDALGDRAWRVLCYPLHEANFHNANDDEVKQYWREREANAMQQRKGKYQWALRMAWKGKEKLRELFAGLDQGEQERESILRGQLASYKAPAHVKAIPAGSVDRICSVWWAEQFCKATGEALNASRLAQVMIDWDRGEGKKHNVLRQMVATDLKRIRKLESSAKYNNGVPIWPKFKHPALT